MRWFFIIAILIDLSSFAQCKTYKIGLKGDTLNCTDFDQLKQGKWVRHIESLRGEPGYDEEGIYKNDKKEGAWRSYTPIGDIRSIENFKWGNKHGTCSYYDIYGLLRQESWKATNPENPYDTIDVPDLHSDAVYKRIIKIEATTVRHGTWSYYDPQTGRLVKTENYTFDFLEDPAKKKAAANNSVFDSTAIVKADSARKIKPAEVLQYEKKNSGKKKIKVRDGATGGPN